MTEIFWSASVLCTSTVTIQIWRDMEEPTVGWIASQLHQLEENLTSSLWVCVSVAEELLQHIKQLKENISSFLFTSTSISANKSQLFFCSRERYVGCMQSIKSHVAAMGNMRENELENIPQALKIRYTICKKWKQPKVANSGKLLLQLLMSNSLYRCYFWLQWRDFSKWK